MTFNPNGDAIETVFYLNDTSSMYLPALQKMGFHDPKNEVVDSKMELEFESCPKETLYQTWYVVFSFVFIRIREADSLKHIPRPVYALLFSIPFTSTWETITRAKEMAKPPYKGSGPDEPAIWFKKAINGACGSMGLLHCLLNGPAHEYILPNTILSRLYERSIPLGPDERATMLYNDQKFEDAHQAIAALVDKSSSAENIGKPRRHFVAFIRGEDGSLWEMDGSRGGPIRREPTLEEHEDLLTDDILKFCMAGFVDTNSDEVSMCSCIALAKHPTEAVTLPLNSLSRGHLVNGRSEGVQPRTFWDPAWYGQDHWPPPSK